MVRWRFCVLLTVLLLLPLEIGSDSDEADDEESDEGDDNGDSNDNGDDEDEEDVPKVKPDGIGIGMGIRTPPILLRTTHTAPIRTTKRRPLECYICAHKPDSLLRACLDPTKFRVHTITCNNVDDKCFTSVVSKGSSFEAVVRGCRSGCIGSPDITCCELNRCNNQAFSMPIIEPQALVRKSSATKTFPSSVLFFVTILLVLQTVVKVTFV